MIDASNISQICLNVLDLTDHDVVEAVILTRRRSTMSGSCGVMLDLPLSRSMRYVSHTEPQLFELCYRPAVCHGVRVCLRCVKGTSRRREAAWQYLKEIWVSEAVTSASSKSMRYVFQEMMLRDSTRVLNQQPVSYTHLTLPTKRIV